MKIPSMEPCQESVTLSASRKVLEFSQERITGLSRKNGHCQRWRSSSQLCFRWYHLYPIITKGDKQPKWRLELEGTTQ